MDRHAGEAMFVGGDGKSHVEKGVGVSASASEHMGESTSIHIICRVGLSFVC